jgi:lipopolysaccharide biosynthesis glycosyltransferase
MISVAKNHSGASREPSAKVQPMEGESVAIATVADQRFLPAACCQLVSTASHLKSDLGAKLFLVLCDVSDEDIGKARRFFARRGMAVEIIVPDFTDKMLPPLETRWPRAAYLRLYFDWIFDERWKRIVYLDADTRVCAPLLPLLRADLRGRPVGAVHDFIYYVTGNIHRRRRDLFLSDDAPYLQSGVMVFDWHKVLAGKDLARAREFLIKHPEACYEAPDQDALNAIFENRWTPLDPRWNMHELYLMFGGKLRPYIMHFTSIKPWSRHRPRAWREPAEWYQRELAEFWPEFVEPQSGWEALCADLELAQKQYGPWLRDAMAKMLPPLGRTDNGFKPWVPRHARDVEDMARALILEAEGRCPPLRPPEIVLSDGHW